MRAQLRPAVVSLILFTVITGVVYPLAVTGLAQVLFPHQANGSLMVKNGQALGSALIGQPFDDPKYFLESPVSDLAVSVQRGRLSRLQPRPAERRPGQGGAGPH